MSHTEAICSVEDCRDRVYASGFCNWHATMTEFDRVGWPSDQGTARLEVDRSLINDLITQFLDT